MYVGPGSNVGTVISFAHVPLRLTRLTCDSRWLTSTIAPLAISLNMPRTSWRTHTQIADVVTLLDSISTSEKFSQAVQGFPLRSAWGPPPPTEFDEVRETSEVQAFIKKLGIPNVEDLEFPAMLLYQLGSFNAREDLKARKEDIFNGSHTFLVNTSGSGKTRLLLEGLCDEWGLYFTSQVDSGLLGSFDIQKTMVERLENKSGFVLFPSLLAEPEATHATLLNTKITRIHSSLVLLSRLLVFEAFLSQAITLGGGVSPALRKFWLHFQLRPNIQTEDEQFTDHLADVFLDICEALLRAEVDDTIINDVIAQTSRKIVTILGGTAKIFIVLDEANVAVRRCEDSFRDDNGNHYPLLKAVLKTWREHLKDSPFVFIIAGTEIPQRYFNDSDWMESVWNSNTGAFDNQMVQKGYVQQFLSHQLWGSIGDSLTSRMWRWLRGRHRFTSAYIAVLLEHSYAKPLTYLDMVVDQGTGYFPQDVPYDVRPPRDFIPFAKLNFSKIRTDRILRSYVHLALIDALSSSTNPGYSVDAIKLVNEGMGRFTDTRCSHIVVDEPLIIARAVTWFSGNEGETPASILNYQYFIDHLVNPEMSPRHPPAYLAFALALAFGRSRRISDILALSKPIPTWSRRNADIVVRKQAGDGVIESPVRHVDRIHRTLVTYSTTLADTLSWMTHHHRTPFCIHVTETTVTLIFIVKLSNNTRFWATMRVLHSLADEDVATKIWDTAHDLQAENLFQEPASPSFYSDILDALDSLPSICPQVCPHGVLPIIAVLGKGIENIEPDVLYGSESSRVALVKLDELSQAMDLIPPEQIAERIINAITRDPEKPEEEAEEEVEEMTTRTKARRKLLPRTNPDPDVLEPGVLQRPNGHTVTGWAVAKQRIAGVLLHMSENSWKNHGQTTAVLALLDSISASDKFSQAVQGLPLRSIWRPPPPTDFDETTVSTKVEEFIQDLHIPLARTLSFPAMLLHRLGSFQVEDLRVRKEDIFSGKNTFLVNTSGSGKTRLLFEGLCDDWGLYFTSHVDSGFLGSFDVQTTMVDSLGYRTGFVLFPSRLPEPAATHAAALNMQFARSHASRILLSRLLIFKSFLDCAIALGGLSQEQRKLWLHFQLQPNVQGEHERFTRRLADVSLDLCEVLADAEINDTIVDNAIAQTSAEIVMALGESTRIFIVLDEANVAVKTCRRSFRDDHGNYYPLLKAMLKIWRGHLHNLPFVFVVAGTEIPQEYFANDLEWADSVWSSHTGSFDDPEDQKRYVKQFLPAGLWESIGEPLSLRLWRWMRGRHRFTSTYIAVLLQHSYAKPLTYLDMVIHQGTGYFPHDVHYDVRPPTDTVPLDLLDFEMMIVDRRLRSYVHLALMDTLLSSSNPGYSAEAIILVNEGMGLMI
ncbi:hypothetical protein WG66_013380 [Moniliophthora roreri]|nr:hypothetical protein WG66_013380 [Moniliophthora roreri]